MEILNMLGLSTETVSIIIAAILFFERIAKIIPDDATGMAGMTRKLAKFLGAYTSNRKTDKDNVG